MSFALLPYLFSFPIVYYATEWDAVGWSVCYGCWRWFTIKRKFLRLGVVNRADQVMLVPRHIKTGSSPNTVILMSTSLDTDGLFKTLMATIALRGGRTLTIGGALRHVLESQFKGDRR